MQGQPLRSFACRPAPLPGGGPAGTWSGAQSPPRFAHSRPLRGPCLPRGPICASRAPSRRCQRKVTVAALTFSRTWWGSWGAGRGVEGMGGGEGSETPAAAAAAAATSKSNITRSAVRMERMIIPAVALLTVGRAIDQECCYPAGGGEAAAPNRAEGDAGSRSPPAAAARPQAGPSPGAAGLPGVDSCRLGSREVTAG